MSKTISFKSYDGTELQADFFKSDTKIGALLAHGITSERTEAGLYTKVANNLKNLGINSMLLDLRGHGASSGSQEDFLISGAINDICSGVEKLKSFGMEKILIIAASFSGGLAVRASELQNGFVSHLVLLNPRLKYTPWIHDPVFWKDGTLTQQGQESISKFGFLERNGFKLSKPMVNELISFDPVKGIISLQKPVLFIHGTNDTVIPIEDTRFYQRQLKNSELIEIEKAQHGFTDPETDDPSTPKSQQIRDFVVEQVTNWVKKNVCE